VTCAMLEERSFELLTSADAMWAIRKHSAMRIEAQRGASLVLFNETCRSGNEGGKQKVGGKARRERQNERAKHSGYCTLVGRSGESRGRIVALRSERATRAHLTVTTRPYRAGWIGWKSISSRGRISIGGHSIAY